jgi:pimeloyl-ACP methyl ester carboxylesterase
MRWVEQGEGSPLVLIHGIPTSPLVWREVIPRIVGARCLAWEMVGYGASAAEGRDRDISVSAQADYLALWLKHLGIDRAVLAGHDLGGGGAQVAAIRYPGLCAGLFLTNAIAYDSRPAPPARALHATNGVVRPLPGPLFKVTFRSWLRRGHERSEQAAAALAAHWPYYAADGAARLARQVNALDVEDTLAVADRLANFNVPARVVWGEDDAWRRIAHGERFARDLRAPLRRIAGAKHWSPINRGPVSFCRCATRSNSFASARPQCAPLASYETPIGRRARERVARFRQPAGPAREPERMSRLSLAPAGP